MKEFEYVAIVFGGDEQCGTISAEDSKDAIQQIRDMGLFPTKVREKVSKKEREYRKTYFQYIAELLGDKLIEIGKNLKE